ncbi:MAG: phosphoglycerate mutase (2,3-diphosphoglycerate-independent), partial [Candidatus Moranbacteria bacterium]|nr:phosphoglycerate mutase (2,3-diphosphoglycerate-independent) [Candidatus Moranbacteria bacterium]
MTKNKKGPVVLCILDGWGETNEIRGNAIAKAELPVIDKLNKHYVKTYLQASGIAVGLPWGVVGNSEVGHQAMGTGQIIYQKLPIINTAIQDESFFENEVLIKAIEFAKENKSKIHLFGLVSDGGVHSHIEHLFALLEVMKKNEFEDVYIHAVMDGRDTAPQSAQVFLNDLLSKIKQVGVGQIATVSGRYYPMDRSQNWDRVEKAYNAMVYGEGLKAETALNAVDAQYRKDVKDEFIEPTVIEEAPGKPVAKIKEGDVFISFNFRKDRAKQIIKAFALSDFKKF